MLSTEFGKAVSTARTHMCPAAACATYGAKGDVCRSPMHVDRDGRQIGLKLIPIPKRRKSRRKSAKIVRESEVEAGYIAEREAEGKLVLKVKVLGRPGYPDRWVLNGSAPLAAFLVEHIGYNERHGGEVAAELLAQCFHMAELKQQANSRFQPKQKTIIPMLRKRGFKVDIVHG